MPQDDLCRRVLAVRGVLRSDRRSCELRLSLFAAALYSYRKDTCLKPFPQSYVWEGHKQYDLLMEVVKKIPPVATLLEKLEDQTYIDLNEDVIDVLHQVLIDFNGPALVSVPSDQIDTILEKAPSAIPISKPQYIFEMVNSDRSQSESKWRNLAKDNETFFAYHGSRLENFHSICHHGLQQHMSKNKLFGSGTYLSSELSVSLPYSPIGLNWECSSLGQYLSCIAMCELVNVPPGIVSQKNNSVSGGQSAGPRHSRASDSLAGDIPHTYYVVSNNDLVRVRYLLVYAKDLPPGRNQAASNAVRKGAVRQWMSQYKMLIMMLAYVFVLTVIGLSNNHSTYYYYRSLLKKYSIFN